jgi:hypothetical protein
VGRINQPKRHLVSSGVQPPLPTDPGSAMTRPVLHEAAAIPGGDASPKPGSAGTGVGGYALT